MSNPRLTVDTRRVLAVGVGLLLAALLTGSLVAAAPGDSPDVEPVGQDATDSPNVFEEAYREPAPEPGDPYFEAQAKDGSWISYINPRDEYREPYIGDGSGKICTTLLNEEGEVVAGETVPNTTVTIPTGESLSWHSSADPITVEYPMTDHYDRPLDADQFGTDPDLPQGDGYMDSHCVEFHGLPEDGRVEYGEATVDGTHADRIDVVGYIQQEGAAWNSSVDPVADVEPIDKAGGWSYESGQSHGQAVVVLQLNYPEETNNETDTEDGSSEGNDGNDDKQDAGDDGDGEEGDDGRNDVNDGDCAGEKNDRCTDSGGLDYEENGSEDDATESTNDTSSSADSNGEDKTGVYDAVREEENSIIGAFVAILVLSGVLTAVKSR